MAETQPYKFDWTQPQGSQLRQQGMDFAGIDAGALNQQAAIAGQQQREQNIGAYNAAVASQRGSNPALANFGMGQNLANVNAQTGAGVQNIQAQNEFGAQSSNQNALLQYYQTLTSANASKYGIDEQSKIARREQNLGIWEKLLGAGANVGTAVALSSDERNKQPEDEDDEFLHRHLTGKKKMQEQGDKSARNFMDTLKPQAFEYKPGTGPDDGGKPHLGIMAQNLEKTKEGAGAVMDSPEGKIIDTAQLTGMLAATIGDLHQRLTRLEGGMHGRT